MSDNLHKAMCLLVKKKFPDKFKRCFNNKDYTSVWIFDDDYGRYYCLYCDQVLDMKFKNNHALQHLKDNKLLAFL